jgi:glycosyltransferase involved in cell wall biosynthesis
MKLPRISVVTPSFNQGRYIGRTIESVLAQGYPDVEHIVVDGMSTDETPQVLARYPHLRVLREPDRGQAEAINKGFRLAKGAIFCFLNSDDTYLPGALHRVAREIDPAAGRHVVMGRCIYVDENDVPTGLEHPSAFESHRRILEVWKIHCVPQPATFWTSEAWRRCGPMDESEQLVLDYDLMCRLSRRYRFHEIDQVLATYRLHAASKSCANTEQKIIEHAIRVSRQHWGSPLSVQYWRLRASLACHRSEKRLQRLLQARDHAIRSYQCRVRGQWLRAAKYWAMGVILAPDIAVRRRLLLCGCSPRGRRESPITRAWRNFTGMHSDGLVGPTYITPIELRSDCATLCIEGECVLPWLPLTAAMEVSVDGQVVARHRAAGPGSFSISAAMTGMKPGSHTLRITTRPTLVPHDYTGLNDPRPLGFRLKRLRLEEAAPAAARSNAWLPVAG